MAETSTERCPTGICPKGDCRCGGKQAKDPVPDATRTVPEALPKHTATAPFGVKGTK